VTSVSTQGKLENLADLASVDLVVAARMAGFLFVLRTAGTPPGTVRAVASPASAVFAPADAILVSPGAVCEETVFARSVGAVALASVLLLVPLLCLAFLVSGFFASPAAAPLHLARARIQSSPSRRLDARDILHVLFLVCLL
jgi:hypothetical protein